MNVFMHNLRRENKNKGDQNLSKGENYGAERSVMGLSDSSRSETNRTSNSSEVIVWWSILKEAESGCSSNYYLFLTLDNRYQGEKTPKRPIS